MASSCSINLCDLFESNLLQMLWPPWGKYLGNGIANDNYSINENVNDKAIVNGGDTDNGNDNVNGSNNGNDNDIDSQR